MPLETIEVGQVTEPAPEQTEEEQRYHADIARLEAALQAAEDLYDQAERAVWTQAQRYATVQAIDALGGFQRRDITPPTEKREQSWRDTPKRDKEDLTRLIETRNRAVHGIEQARIALIHKQSVWEQARAREAFLATPKGQVLQRELDEILAAYEVAKTANQSHMSPCSCAQKGPMQRTHLPDHDGITQHALGGATATKGSPMRRIIGTTRTPVYNAQGTLIGHVTETDSVEDTTPTPAPVRTLTTNAQPCARCHQAQTACRCTPPQPRAQAQDDEEGFMPKSILNTRNKDAQPAVMSAETRAMRTAIDQWDTVFYKCLGHPYFDGRSAELRGCSTQQLITIYGRLESGEVVKEVLTDIQKAWTPKSILGPYRP